MPGDAGRSDLAVQQLEGRALGHRFSHPGHRWRAAERLPKVGAGGEQPGDDRWHAFAIGLVGRGGQPIPPAGQLLGRPLGAELCAQAFETERGPLTGFVLGGERAAAALNAAEHWTTGVLAPAGLTGLARDGPWRRSGSGPGY